MAVVKLVFLKLKNGDFNQGFEVTLRIMTQPYTSSFIEVEGRFPPAPHIPEIYQNWRRAYLKMHWFVRGRKEEATPNVGGILEDCQASSQKLRDSIKNWLNYSPIQEFQKIREALLRGELKREEEIKVILQTQDELLKKLPWLEWDLFSEIYTQAEIVLSPPENSVIPRTYTPETSKSHIKLLAILGNNEGINIEEDRAFLNNLPQTKPVFLTEPKRAELSDNLWEKNWDILFFAGHSSSDSCNGNIDINPQEKLPVSQLKHGLIRAIERGLQLAIFNSCDGLKLAENLADLHIPLVIVMGEPVPDRVAQGFLKYFLSAYSSGESLYMAVRKARDRLDTEGLNQQFPGATWLPIIYQNPTVEPPTWKGFLPPPRWKRDRVLSGHQDIVKVVTISPKGNIMASGSLDKTIKLWNLQTGELLHTLTGHSTAIISLAFSPDGNTLASASNMELLNGGTIKLWNVNTGNLIETLGSSPISLRTSCLAFSPDGQTLASGQIGVTALSSIINLWNLATKKITAKLRGHGWEVNSIAFSTDGQILVSGAMDCSIKVWNWHREKLLYTLNRPEPDEWVASMVSWFDSSLGMILCVAISPDNLMIASCGSDQPIKLWNAQTGKEVRTLTEHTDTVYSLSFSPDGKTLASGSADNTIKIWNFHTGELLQTLEHLGPVKSVAFSSVDAKTLVSGSADNTIKIWRLSP
ncbi:MAG: CHAT domain-containing protein [Microcoleaceae cyanobacterium]